jgi:hexokinase
MPYRTHWDERLDQENEKPGFQPLEQMAGGRYLGELVRLVALDLFSPRLERLPLKMTTPYALDTKLCSQIEAADTPDLVLSCLKEYFSDDGEGAGFVWDAATALSFRRVCVAVSTRAAALVAAATVGLLCLNDELSRQAGDDDILVCYTGTVMEKYPGFRERCEGFVADVVGGWWVYAGLVRKTVRFVEAKDGGVLGAAVLAAMVKDGRT